MRDIRGDGVDDVVVWYGDVVPGDIVLELIAAGVMFDDVCDGATVVVVVGMIIGVDRVVVVVDMCFAKYFLYRFSIESTTRELAAVCSSGVISGCLSATC